MRRLLVCYGILNSVLYISLLPLWDGFDEPFHYGYVQHLSTGRGLPVLDRTALSDEIWESIKLAPASQYVVRNLPVALSFRDYFELTQADRRARRVVGAEQLVGCVDEMELHRRTRW